jgi:aminomethyltransferase
MGSHSDHAKLLTTPLHAVHRRLRARMVDFAGWDMPVQYPTGILEEHEAVRTGCGLFDLSHMGRVFARGVDALALGQECCTRDLASVHAGEAAYSVVCDESGAILDDVIASRTGEVDLLFVYNAANRLTDLAWFQAASQRHRWEVELSDRTLETALIGVQGPKSQELLEKLSDADLEDLPGYAFVWTEVAGATALVSRTGYTGEDGFEIMVEADDAEHVWNQLMQRGSQPCGLGARDTLRIEAGFPLYGQDIDRSRNPFEARLGWVVNLSKPAFVGREALARIKADGPSRRLVGLRVAPGGVPRPALPILFEGARVGEITSGTFSPSLKHNIAMGYVPLELSKPAESLAIELRGRSVPAEVVSLPFVPHRTRARAKI